MSSSSSPHRARRGAFLLATAATVTAAVAGVGGAAMAAGSGSPGDTRDNPMAAASAAVHRAAAPEALAEARYAVVNGTGTLARGTSGVSSAATGLTGNYEVLFDRDVRGCAYTGTIGNPGAGAAAPGFITVQQRSGKTNGVFVTVKDTAGNRAAQPFHLVVTC